MLYNEPTEHWEEWVGGREGSVRDRFDFVMHTNRSVQMPITTICNWGRDIHEYLRDPSEDKVRRGRGGREGGGDIVYFCDHGVAPEYQKYIQEFLSLVRRPQSGVVLIDQGKASEYAGGEGVYHVDWRLGFYGSHKFALITEASLEKDWVSLDYSQTLLGGAVPIYIGARNIEEFFPGVRGRGRGAETGIVDIRDFRNPMDLFEHVRMLLNDETEYRKYFEWKKKGLSHHFLQHLDRCVYYAECRICEKVLRMKSKR